MTTLSFYTAGADKPKKLVVLLHGLGADGQDLRGIGEVWAKDMPSAQFVTPDAPFPCDMAPYGRQWFSLMNWSAEQITNGIAAARPALDAFLDEQLALHGLTDADLVLGGFSQGAMMSLFCGPQRPRKIAGILAYSGGLFGAAHLRDAHRPPVCLVHGEMDFVVPVLAYDQSLSALHGMGFDVDGHRLFGLGHAIDNRGLQIGLDFLKKTVG